jgi:hypothetical protein
MKKSISITAVLVFLIVTTTPSLASTAHPASQPTKGVSIQANTPFVYEKTSLSRAKLLVRKLFYGYTQAFQKGTESGLAYVRKANYPGFVDYTKPEWIAIEATQRESGRVSSAVPKLNTLIPDPKWKIAATACSKKMKRPPKGETFLINVKFVDQFQSTGESSSTTADIHVTVLNNKAYFYLTCY